MLIHQEANMTQDHDSTRRNLLAALAGITLANVAITPAAASASAVQNRSRILVAFFSRSGNTRVIAGVIHRTLHTDLFEIVPAEPYPEDYSQTVEQASSERERGIRPAFKNALADLSRYETIYLGFPIWGGTVPPVVQTFLATYRLAGKNLVPFITHGGYGAGSSPTVLANLAPDARREEALVMECDQEKRTTDTVERWLGKIAS